MEISRTPVLRAPIKIRSPIQREFCKCWDIFTLLVDGVPHCIDADRMSVQDLDNFLSSIEVCMPIHLSNFSGVYDSRVEVITKYKVPVVVHTNKVLPQKTLKLLASVPHSGIQLYMDSANGFMEDFLGEGSSAVEDLMEMSFLAKAWKTFVTLEVDYYPHIMSRIDLYDTIDSMRNSISHLFLRPKNVSDEYFYFHKDTWDSLSLDIFRQYYQPDVPSRSWVIKPSFRKQMASDLVSFLTGKKIGLELLHDGLSREIHDNRVRHTSSGYSSLPMGIKPFYYRWVDNDFAEFDSVEGFICEKCEKPIFA